MRASALSMRFCKASLSFLNWFAAWAKASMSVRLLVCKNKLQVKKIYVV